MRNKPKNNKLFRTWLIIELCFFAFMTAVTTSVYFYTNHHIIQQLDALHMSSLKRMEAEVSAIFDSGIATVNEYMMQPKIRTLAGADLSANERDVASLIDDIKQTNSAVKGVSEIIIYFKNEDVFVSSAGVMDQNIFNEVYSSTAEKETNIPISNAIMDEKRIGRIVSVYNGRNDTNTAIFTGKPVNNIYVSVVIDYAQVEDILTANLQDDRNAYCVFSGNELLYTHGSSLSKEICAAIGLQENNQFQKIESKNQGFVCLTSGEDELKYVSLIDEENYLAGQLGVQRTAMIMLAVSIILGAGISYYITRYKYKPVERVINVSKAITPRHVFASNDNELEQIKNAIELIYEQKEQAKSVLEKHNTHILDHAIKMLLDGDIRYQDMTQHIKSLINIASNAVYTVAVMDVKFYDNISCEIESLKKHLANIKYIVRKDGRTIIIFEENAKDVVVQLSRQCFIEALKGTVAVGAEGIGTNGIQSSYAHALLGLSRKILPGTPKVIPPLKNKEANAITISAESEIRLGGYIQSGDTEKALVLLKELTQEQGINNLNDFSFKTYLYNISNVIIRSAESVFDDDMITKLLDNFGISFQEEDYQRISKALKDAIVYVTEAYKEKMGSANKRLNASLIQYIENKISDSQLSSEMIAEAMNLNAAYLRRFFKEQNGITLWDFINMKRIEMAKGLLIATCSSIKSIALSCGYISISTFVRTFKKFSGMTPGHYRNLYR